ncbi:MAG: hypothetical protein P3A28_03630 [Gemmatimonadota bacterium]|nr:hypothetical protein [Gemmatimonadota bacterium]
MITETRERFIRAIAEHIEPGRIVEAYFFPSIRQGPMETGVAVLAATPPVVASVAGETPLEFDLPVEPAPEDAASAEPDDPRTEVLTASYRWTRKGPDRGKWEVEVIAEADAPLATVERVVRGVQERAGEALDAHRMSANEIRTVFLEPIT